MILGVPDRARQFYPKADTARPDAELRALAAAGELVSLEEARDLLAGAGIEASSVSRLATGTFHEVFAVDAADRRPRVLKVTRLDPPEDGLLVEAGVSELLDGAGVATVRVLEHGTSGRRRWSLAERAEGDSFRSFDGDETAVVEALPALARHLRRIHDVPVDGWGLLAGEPVRGTHASWGDYLRTRLDGHVELLVAAGSIDEATAREAERVVTRLAGIDFGTPRLLHGDIGPHNAVLGTDVRLLDWEDALGGDPAFDVAMWATFNPPRRWPVFFDAYHGEGWEPDFRFWASFLRISLAKAVVRLRFGYHDLPGREPASARIPRAIAAIAALDPLE